MKQIEQEKSTNKLIIKKPKNKKMKFIQALFLLYIFKNCFIIIIHLLFKIFTQHSLEILENDMFGRNGSHNMNNELVDMTG